MFQIPPLEFLDILWINLLWLSILFPVFVLFSMRRILRLVQPEHRLCSPNDVWWCLIPVVGNVLLFVVTKRIAKSLYRQFDALGQHALFRDFGLEPMEDYGAARGLHWALLGILSNFFWLFIVHLNELRPFNLMKFGFALFLPTLILSLEAVYYWNYISIQRKVLIRLLQPAKSAEESDFHDEGEKSGGI